jgi:cobalt transporter subunit CbtB
MTSNTSTRVLSVSQRLIAGAALFFFGSFLVWGTGLAKDERMHNAAHDTRHSIGFPCH